MPRLHLLTLLVSWLALAAAASAKPTEFKIPLGPVYLDVPKEWKAVPNLFGVPLAVLGPKKDGSRPTFYVIPLGRRDELFPTKTIATGLAQFRADTEAALKEDGAELLEFFPYKKTAWKKAVEVHALGFRYRRDGVEMVEHTYFTYCGGQLYHIKDFATVAQAKDQAKALVQLTDTFSCLP